MRDDFEPGKRLWGQYLRSISGMSGRIGVPFDANFEHLLPSWGPIRTWLENIRRFANAS
jgi:hypothetical protein